MNIAYITCTKTIHATIPIPRIPIPNAAFFHSSNVADLGSYLSLLVVRPLGGVFDFCATRLTTELAFHNRAARLWVEGAGGVVEEDESEFSGTPETIFHPLSVPWLEGAGGMIRRDESEFSGIPDNSFHPLSVPWLEGAEGMIRRDESECSGIPDSSSHPPVTTSHSWPHFLHRHSGVLVFLL